MNSDRTPNFEDAYAVASRVRQSSRSLIDAIKAVRSECGLNLGQAKQFVAKHPDWIAIAQSQEPFHDELERLFDEAEKIESEEIMDQDP